MPEPASQSINQWQLPPARSYPIEFAETVRAYLPPDLDGQYITQLLWQRGIHDCIDSYLNAQHYQPQSPFEFGQEMEWAVKRLVKAYRSREIVGIWGDFDADGVTATSVLWDGLGEFFPQDDRLFYYIPNRFTESHGLSAKGLDELAAKGCQLVVTCDTGSTNDREIEYAKQLGMDVIVTDHHTLPEQRPSVIAIVNPRYLERDHPLASLSGVAVAFKLVEALYEKLPEIPEKPLEQLLDLVAIGLIADLVELKGDCRYLAQRGIQQLQKQSNPATMTRPGVAKLLELCRRSGDRPTDISFGLGPRINAVSRIQGDAHFCVELLTSGDRDRCQQLAEETELANGRRKALQKEVLEQVQAKAKQLDLSTTAVIVLWDEQWSPGVLGLVAGQIAQEFGRPTILLSVEGELARGSARSAHQIDLYQLVKFQEHLLHRFGGHPFAAGLSIAVENLPLFAAALNQRLLQQGSNLNAGSTVQADLSVTVAELGLLLYKELRLIEPCGMGNPMPRLLIQNCWFEAGRNTKAKDFRGRKVEYMMTPLRMFDESQPSGFPGLWWGHYAHELPKGRCDAIVELENNTFRKQYEVRLIAVRPKSESIAQLMQLDWLHDWRLEDVPEDSTLDVLKVATCPTSWQELQVWFRRAMKEGKELAIAYPVPMLTPAETLWERLVGVAKYLSRTEQVATRQQLLLRLEVSDRALKAGFAALEKIGFAVSVSEQGFRFTRSHEESALSLAAIEPFLNAVNEEQFRRQYFYDVSIETIRSVARQTLQG